MGRGRAKAKQTKVARRLKYSGPDTDLQRLEAELKGEPDDTGTSAPADETDADLEDPYAKYVDDESR
ncbi:MAG: DUF3073 domain-containing protein [Candidatus Nanopelagicales bacterium]|jgi:hypothetical protein